MWRDWDSCGGQSSEAMQAVGLRAARLCYGDSFLAATSSESGSSCASSSLVQLRGQQQPRGGRVQIAQSCASRAVLQSQRQDGLVSTTSRERERSDMRTQSSILTDPEGRSFMTAEQKVYDAVAKQAAMVDEVTGRNQLQFDVLPEIQPARSSELLEEAYVRCGEVCAEYAKTFYLGTAYKFNHECSIFVCISRWLVGLQEQVSVTPSQVSKLAVCATGTKLMTPERQRAIWAIYGTPLSHCN